MPNIFTPVPDDQVDARREEALKAEEAEWNRVNALPIGEELLDALTDRVHTAFDNSQSIPSSQDIWRSVQQQLIDIKGISSKEAWEWVNKYFMGEVEYGDDNDDMSESKKLNEAAEDTSKEEKVAFFDKRTNNHINMVKANCQKIVDAYPEFKDLIQQCATHDASKFQEPEYTPYLDLSWNKFKGIKDTDARSADATLHHITNNAHHPEYWNKDKATLDPKDRDSSKECLEAHAMSNLAIAEMTADWQAMAEELGTNTCREWFNKQNKVRWSWTPEQEALIDKLISVFERDPEVDESVGNYLEKFMPLNEGDFVTLMNFSHNLENCIWVWYYREDTKEIEGYTPDLVTSHHDKGKFKILDGVTSYADLQRGRVIKNDGQYANLIYTDYDATSIDEFTLNDITYKIEKALGIMLLGSMNQEGVSLIERRKDDNS